MTSNNPYEPPSELDRNDLSSGDNDQPWRGPGDAPPTNTRFWVLGLLCTMAFVLYLDRVCIATAVEPIKKEFGLTNTQMSYVLMAFTLAYGLLEVPTGHWGDRYGSRRILARIVVWWSAFTALTAACTGWYSLIVVRFLFGAGEAGAYPNAARIISRWFTIRERGTMQGLFQAASLLGGAVAPTIASLLISLFGWRWPFVIFGGLGVIWAVAFYFWFRDEPSEHPAVNAAEAELLSHTRGTQSHSDPLPWREVVTHPTIWLLGFIVSCSAFNSYLYFSWYPTYLREARLVSQEVSGLMSSLTLFGGMVGTILGGRIVDRLMRRHTRTVGRRRAIACSAFTSAAILVLLSRWADNPWLAATLASCSCVALFTQQTVWWSAATEVSGRYLGALFGLMNGIGGFGALASQNFVGAFADWRKAQGFEGRAQWDPMFTVFAIVLMIGAVAWLGVNPTRVVGSKDSKSAS